MYKQINTVSHTFISEDNTETLIITTDKIEHNIGNKTTTINRKDITSCEINSHKQKIKLTTLTGNSGIPSAKIKAIAKKFTNQTYIQKIQINIKTKNAPDIQYTILDEQTKKKTKTEPKYTQQANTIKELIDK